MLDFSEISTDGTQFELLLREILFSLNYHVVWSGVGADGGRDLLVREEIQSIFGRRSFIPDLIDQNPCAHRRNPMDMIFQGRSMSVFQA